MSFTFSLKLLTFILYFLLQALHAPSSISTFNYGSICEHLLFAQKVREFNNAFKIYKISKTHFYNFQNLDILNQAKNILLVLRSSSVKLLDKSVNGFLTLLTQTTIDTQPTHLTKPRFKEEVGFIQYTYCKICRGLF